MKIRQCALICLALSFSCILAWASDFWKEKDYRQWNDEEISKMLNDSPWAQNTKAQAAQSNSDNGAGRRGGGMGRMGGGGIGMGIPGMGGGMGRGRRGGQQPPREEITVTVRWNSALAVREALLKRAVSRASEDSTHQEALTAPVTHYVIALVGLPERPSSERRRGYSSSSDDDRYGQTSDADRFDQMTSASLLTRKDRPAIYADKIERDKDGSTLLVSFPKEIRFRWMTKKWSL